MSDGVDFLGEGDFLTGAGLGAGAILGAGVTFFVGANSLVAVPSVSTTMCPLIMPFLAVIFTAGALSSLINKSKTPDSSGTVALKFPCASVLAEITSFVCTLFK